MINEEYSTFLEIAERLNKEFSIVPVLYGSLELSKCIGQELKINDIDILIPEKFLKADWEKLQSFMSGQGYKLKDEHEHEFEKEGMIIAFGREEGLDQEAKVDSSKLKIISENDSEFKVLTAQDFKKAYKYCLKDGYRRKKRGKADQEKIDLIDTCLKNQVK